MTGQKMGSKGEKSNFSLACRLLSQYVKEKGGFGGLGLEMAPPKPLDQQAQDQSRAPVTMSLLPGLDVPGDDRAENDHEKNPTKSMDLLPRLSGFDSCFLPKEEESIKTAETQKMEKCQLTIFYSGKVLVFDKFPADKATDLMQMATNESMAAQSHSFSKPLTSTPGADSSSSKLTAKASDMPIPRRNSLRRFLEKRKDRCVLLASESPLQMRVSLIFPELET
ncbi:tify 10b [Musa troglodytarum]|uniref:Protein TIFY n=1 Tax=Musa troglodytarum TaxID=320322 RepID=A0A9E7K6H0_9LILI|nr:tify 10b [Musa troglodytarum]